MAEFAFKLALFPSIQVLIKVHFVICGKLTRWQPHEGFWISRWPPIRMYKHTQAKYATHKQMQIISCWINLSFFCGKFDKKSAKSKGKGCKTNKNKKSSNPEIWELACENVLKRQKSTTTTFTTAKVCLILITEWSQHIKEQMTIEFQIEAKSKQIWTFFLLLEILSLLGSNHIASKDGVRPYSMACGMDNITQENGHKSINLYNNKIKNIEMYKKYRHKRYKNRRTVNEISK